MQLFCESILKLVIFLIKFGHFHLCALAMRASSSNMQGEGLPDHAVMPMQSTHPLYIGLPDERKENMKKLNAIK